MKKISTLLMGLVATAAFSQTEHTLSQTSDDVYVESVSASACMDNMNGYFRLFDLADYGITEEFTVTGVDAAAVIWDGGYGEVKVYTYEGEATESIDYTLLTDTGLYGSFTNGTGERIWNWVSFDILDEASAPIQPGQKFAVAVTHEVTNADAAWLGSYWPLYTDGDETMSAYFGTPDVGCYAVEQGYATQFSSFVTGGKRAILLTVTGTTDGMGLVELNSKALSVYPNPASDVLNISLKSGEVQGVEITNLAGQNVYAGKAAGSVNVNFLAAGVYVVKVKDNAGKTHISKFVKK